MVRDIMLEDAGGGEREIETVVVGVPGMYRIFVSVREGCELHEGWMPGVYEREDDALLAVNGFVGKMNLEAEVLGWKMEEVPVEEGK